MSSKSPMKKRILILGAGLVSKPGVRYLLDDKDLVVTVASRTVSKAEELVKGFANGRARQVNVENAAEVEKLIKENDIVVSLLPWVHHLKVADLCIQHGKDMATTSYVSEGMKKLDRPAREKGLLFLNEIGVDPGIDHMSAMKIIDEVHRQGGKVLHFYSYCGGLPAPHHNDNPFGYKFSWSPKGVVLASRNAAKYLENGQVVEIEGKNLFLNNRVEEIEDLGTFEVYPNRDSLPYKDLYGLKEAETVMRGTYRNPGWCDTLKKIVDLGLVDETPSTDLKGKTFKQMMAGLVGVPESSDVVSGAAEKLGIRKDSQIMDRLVWLGLFSDEKLPDFDNRLDILSQLMQEKLYYKDGEQDMLLMRHKFIIENPDRSRSQITSTMIDYGIPGGDSSMARTVSLPLAIGVKMMAYGQIKLTGVQTATEKEIYEPVLPELERLNIKLTEKKTPL